MRSVGATRVGIVLACLVLAGAGVWALTSGPDPDRPSAAAAVTTILPAPTQPSTSTSASTSTVPDIRDLFERPAWLGTRELPEGPGGFGAVLPTPPELDPRALRPPPGLPDPAGDAFVSTISTVPDAVVARSTWTPDCPVTVDELRYLTVTFWGFDGRHHTGELLVHAAHADAIVSVFGRLGDVRFPIEEMRVTAAFELDLPPTGDGNNTSAFVCRAVRGGTSFSQHAFGAAIDVNPFHNPYIDGEVVLPELASTYVDRADIRPGMFTSGAVAVRAFADIGWEWGGAWSGSTKDQMHFSANGR